MHILRKAHQIPDREHPAVVKYRPAAHPPEDLVLVAHDDFGINLGRTVQHGDKIHLKPAVAGCEFPGAHVAVSGDVEGHVVQLVAHTVVEEHIFGSGARIPESVTDIEAEGLAVDDAVSGPPVPAVIICPDASSPVQCAEVLLRVKSVFLSVEAHPPGGTHGVYFLIVVKCMPVLLPRSRDDHRVHLRLLQLNLAGECLPIPEIFIAAGDTPFAGPFVECHFQAPVVIADGALVGGGRQFESTHWKCI